MQEFFKTNLQTKLIQNILYNTPLPIYKSITEGAYIVEGMFYINGPHIVKCSETGYFKSDKTPKAVYEYIDEFTFGKSYPKLTDTFIPRNNYYDIETHERLGKYLRYIRDCFNVNLFPFYNCFSENYSGKAQITKKDVLDSEGHIISYDIAVTKGTNDDFKVIKIPIKYNQKYTIAIQSSSKVYIAPALLVNDNLLKVSTCYETNIDKTALLNEKWIKDGVTQCNIKTYSTMFYNQPVLYEVVMPPNFEEELAQFENQLYLLIQLPLVNDSTITVLEGDFTTHRKEVFLDVDEYISDKTVREELYYNLSLLTINNNKSYPYSNRLIEFLYLNVIDDIDVLDDSNIVTMQRKADIDINLPDLKEGIWDNRFRYMLFYKYMHEIKTNKKDVSGYIDRDMEEYLNRSKD